MARKAARPYFRYNRMSDGTFQVMLTGLHVADAKAWRTFFRTYAPVILVFLRRCCRGRVGINPLPGYVSPEDLLQGTLIRLLSCAEGSIGEDKCALLKFVITLAKREFLDNRRRLKTVMRDVAREVAYSSLNDQRTTSEAGPDKRAETANELKHLLAGLREKDRAILLAIVTEGGVLEAAVKLTISEWQVRELLRELRRRASEKAGRGD